MHRYRSLLLLPDVDFIRKYMRKDKYYIKGLRRVKSREQLAKLITKARRELSNLILP